MPAIWREQLSTGNERIDQDHKYLFCLFNSIELALSQPESLKHLPIFFNQLLDYSKEHFEREEQIQIKVKYPRYPDHKREHQNIIDSLTRVNDELKELLDTEQLMLVEVPREDSEAADDDESPAVDPESLARVEKLQRRLRKDVLLLARDWIIEHVVKTDKDMQPYLKQFPANFE